MFRKFYDNNDAVSPVVGVVLLLAIFMIVIATIQSIMVPQWSRETELSHRHDVIEDIYRFRLSIQNVAIDEIPRRDFLSLGTRYPDRILFINPGPGVQGNLKFEPVNVSIIINDNLPITFQSNRTIYTSDGLLNLPDIIMEHGILITDFEHRNTTADTQLFVVNNDVFIPIIIGNMDTISSMDVESLDITPFEYYNNFTDVTSINITMDIHNATVWEDAINNNSNITVSDNTMSINIANLDNVTIQVPDINNISKNAIYSGMIRKVYKKVYDKGWLFRRPITITGSAGAGTNYQVLLRVGESVGAYGHHFHIGGNSARFPAVRNDGGDLRFTDNDGTTSLDFWVEKVEGTVVSNRTAHIWVEVRDNLNTTQNIFIYYGNAVAGDVSNGAATFLLFDDFEDGIIDPKWSFQGLASYSESDGSLNLEANTETWHNLNTGAHASLPAPLSNYHILVDAEWVERPLDLAQIILNMKSSEGSIARVGMLDAWAAHRGGRFAWAEGGESFHSGAGTEPASRRTKFEIYRTGNAYDFHYGGLNIFTGTGTSLTNSIVLTNTRFQTFAGKTAQYHLIRVRKFVSPEPAFCSAGPEES